MVERPGPSTVDGIRRRASGLVASAVLIVVFAGTGCSGGGRAAAVPTGSLELQSGPLEPDWAVAATGKFRDTEWTLESKSDATGQVCARLRDGSRVLASPPCVADIATVLATSLLDPGNTYGFLLGITDPRILSIRFTTTVGIATVPVSRQVFVYWTDHPFSGPKHYDALDAAGYAISANVQCTAQGCG